MSPASRAAPPRRYQHHRAARAAAAARECPRCLAGAKVCAEDVDLKHSLQALRGHVREPHGGRSDAGVDDNALERSKIGSRLREHRDDVRFQRNVAPKRGCARAPPLYFRRGFRGSSSVVAIVDGNGPTALAASKAVARPIPRDPPVINTVFMHARSEARCRILMGHGTHPHRDLSANGIGMRQTVRFAAKHPRDGNGKVGCPMNPQSNPSRSYHFAARGCGGKLSTRSASGRARWQGRHQSGVAPQESLDDAWWTGPLLAPDAGTLPQGHWLMEPYVYDLMPYGHFDRNGTLRSAGAAHDYRHAVLHRVWSGRQVHAGPHTASSDFTN